MAGEPTVTSVVQQDFKFATWEGTRGTNIFAPERGEGWQVYAPSAAVMVADFAGGVRWELTALTGYVWSHHNTKGQEASYEGPVDTRLGAKVTLGGLAYVSPFIGVAVNVPTGETFLPGQQRFVRMDPDLVEIGAYGEGLNVNPTLGFTWAPTAALVISPSIGYAWRGKFDREWGAIVKTTTTLADPNTGDIAVMPEFSDLTATRVETNPGDVLTASLISAARIGVWTIQGSYSYISQSEVLQNGIPVGQAGAGHLASLQAVYPVAPNLSITFAGGWRFNERNKVPKNPPDVSTPFGSGGLIEEAKNSNSHVLIGAIQPTFAVTDKLALGLNYSFLWRDKNYYNIIEDQFIPARTKHSVGLVLDYALSKNAVITLSGSRFWANEGGGPPDRTVQIQDNPDASFLDLVSGTTHSILPERNYNGWTGALTAKVQF